jgi:hypothetical protein
VWRLVAEHWVTADRIDMLSIDDVADANEALDLWAEASRAKGG